MKREKRLSELACGEVGRVKNINFFGAERRRMLDVGICVGVPIRCVGISPSGALRAFLIRGCEVAIRDKDSCFIDVD